MSLFTSPIRLTRDFVLSWKRAAPEGTTGEPPRKRPKRPPSSSPPPDEVGKHEMMAHHGSPNSSSSSSCQGFADVGPPWEAPNLSVVAFEKLRALEEGKAVTKAKAVRATLKCLDATADFAAFVDAIDFFDHDESDDDDEEEEEAPPRGKGGGGLESPSSVSAIGLARALTLSEAVEERFGATHPTTVNRVRAMLRRLFASQRTVVEAIVDLAKVFSEDEPALVEFCATHLLAEEPAATRRAALRFVRAMARNGATDRVARFLPDAPPMFLVTDPTQLDQPIVFASQTALDALGYAKVDVIGRDYRFLHGPRTDPATAHALNLDSALQPHFLTAVHQPLTLVRAVVHYRADGKTLDKDLVLVNIRDTQGNPVNHFVFYFPRQPDDDDNDDDAADDDGASSEPRARRAS